MKYVVCKAKTRINPSKLKRGDVFTFAGREDEEQNEVLSVSTSMWGTEVRFEGLDGKGVKTGVTDRINFSKHDEVIKIT